MYQYPKQILTIAQQVQSYIDAGMEFADQANVEKALKSVGDKTVYQQCPAGCAHVTLDTLPGFFPFFIGHIGQMPSPIALITASADIMPSIAADIMPPA